MRQVLALAAALLLAAAPPALADGVSEGGAGYFAADRKALFLAQTHDPAQIAFSKRLYDGKIVTVMGAVDFAHQRDMWGVNIASQGDSRGVIVKTPASLHGKVKRGDVVVFDMRLVVDDTGCVSYKQDDTRFRAHLPGR